MSDTHSGSQLGLFDCVSGTAISLGCNHGPGVRDGLKLGGDSRREISSLAKEACVEPQPGLIKVKD